jgi:glucosamine--fructose-6-phosphate aminotransferase (isomerizing)
MCGIFGYAGPDRDLGPAILASLRALEYRGYDSWGVAVAADGGIRVEKAAGKIAGATVDLPPSGLGFGHTRWATHGGVTRENAHPHLDCGGQVAVIHNGIVENFRALRDDLIARGHVFRSDTDSEVVAHLLEEELAAGATLLDALARVFPRLDGLNAIIAMAVGSHELVAAKNISPLVVGLGNGLATIASDATALLGYADVVHYVEDDEIVRLTPGAIEVFDRATLAPRLPRLVPIPVDRHDLALHGHPHYMAREMHEQPDVVARIAATHLPEIAALAAEIRAADRAFLVGCGTAHHAALSGAYLFSRIASRHIDTVAGSEFAYHAHFLTPRSLVIALSQSGETADLVAAMHAARRAGSRLGAIVNSPNSTLDRMVDLRVHLDAGPEQCVLSTKAYTAKVATLILLAHALAGTPEEGQRVVARAAEGLRAMLVEEWIANVRAIGHRIAAASDLFVIGRGLSYPTALEAALKIKEVSDIHAEGFAGGELKHGVIALITQDVPCVVYAPNDETRADILSGAMELKSRGGYIIGIGPTPDPVFDDFIPTPEVGDAAPIVQALPAQMLGYHAALVRGYDPDKPRNLAKSVTVK